MTQFVYLIIQQVKGKHDTIVFDDINLVIALFRVFLKKTIADIFWVSYKSFATLTVYV